MKQVLALLLLLPGERMQGCAYTPSGPWSHALHRAIFRRGLASHNRGTGRNRPVARSKPAIPMINDPFTRFSQSLKIRTRFRAEKSPAPSRRALQWKIPDAEKGWPAALRVRWFRTFAMNVSQIYDGDDEAVEMKIEETKEAAN
jgi:hypothetical protein